jgi:hypothetical protein
MGHYFPVGHLFLDRHIGYTIIKTFYLPIKVPVYARSPVVPIKDHFISYTITNSFLINYLKYFKIF